jgi:hypothetical protein
MAIPPTPTPPLGSGPTPAPTTPLIDSSWNGANGGAGVILPTTGDAQEKPYQHMPGSAAGARPGAYLTAAQAVYVPLTGIGSGKLPEAERPASFSSDAPADFAQWHSAFQVEWLKNQTVPFVPNTYSVSDDAGNLVAFYALTEDDRPVNLMTMTKAEYGKLSDADKSIAAGRIGGYLQIINRFEALGLSTDYSKVIDGLSALQTAIRGSSLPDADKAVFLGQLQLLRGGDPRSAAEVSDADMMANITGAVATDVYLERIAAISTRLDRAILFHDAPTPRPVTLEAGIYSRSFFGIVSTATRSTEGQAQLSANASASDRAVISNGYAEFMRAERAILANQTMRAVQASLPYADPRLDVANLINFFQLQYEDEARAIADSGTEEIRQLNKLLQDYAIMQQLVQKQIGFYDPSKTNDKRRFMNVGAFENDYDVRQRIIDGLPPVGVDYRLVDDTGTELWGGLASSTDEKNAVINQSDRPKFHWSLILAGTSGAFAAFNGYAQVDTDSYGAQQWDQNRLNQDQANVVSMFINDFIFEDDRTHPLESLYGASRPSISIVDTRPNAADHSLKLMTKGEWDSFATQLNETVTILNQQNQIRQNEIQNAEKQANRHFELGNNALRKMNDILMSIGRI